jgi:aprataxin and PNK-like factor
MPPKRRPGAEASTASQDLGNGTASTASLGSQLTAVPLPPTLATPSAPVLDSPAKKAKTESDASAADDSHLPVCLYGAKCYRKNPQHFKEFSHPKPGGAPAATTTAAATATITPPASSIVMPRSGSIHLKPEDQKPTAAVSKDFEAYKKLLTVILQKPKISNDEKRVLREYRKSCGVDELHHENLLGQLGWTADEYDAGEKADDDIDLWNEEKKLLDSNSNGIIWLSKDQVKTKDQENVFARVTARFFSTMSVAQANHQMLKLGIIVNPEGRRKFLQRKEEFRSKSVPHEHEWAFHGTSVKSVDGIAATGFLHPSAIKAAAPKPKGKAKPKKSTAPAGITLLDEGYYGNGIYFSTFSDYAMWYSEERESDRMLLCKVLRGNSYRCDKRIDGGGLVKGYHSHHSPGGNEIVIFEPEQILPRYILIFSSQDAEEREQEG